MLDRLGSRGQMPKRGLFLTKSYIYILVGVKITGKYVVLNSAEFGVFIS